MFGDPSDVSRNFISRVAIGDSSWFIIFSRLRERLVTRVVQDLYRVRRYSTRRKLTRERRCYCRDFGLDFKEIGYFSGQENVNVIACETIYRYLVQVMYLVCTWYLVQVCTGTRQSIAFCMLY